MVPTIQARQIIVYKFITFGSTNMIKNNYKHELGQPVDLTIMTVIINNNNNNNFKTHKAVVRSLASWSCCTCSIIIIKARGYQRELTIIQDTISGD